MVKYIYHDGKEVKDGDIITKLGGASFLELLYIEFGINKLYCRNLLSSIQNEFSPKSTKLKDSVKLDDCTLLMREIEWKKLMDKMFQKIETINFDVDYEINPILLNKWVTGFKFPGQ